MLSKVEKMDFIIIGAQKAGTSWLYKQLARLPDFTLPPIKELHYFDRSPIYPSSNKLSETYLRNRLLDNEWVKNAINVVSSSIEAERIKYAEWHTKWFFSNYDDNWYLSLFDALEGFTGDITPSYSFLEEKDIQKMYNLVPNAKLILILRNPIDRAWSHYRFNTRKIENNSVENNSVEDIIDFINSDEQELRSDYHRTINNYSKIFPKEQILICFYDALNDNSFELLSQIVEFIGGNPENVSKLPDLFKRFKISPKIDCPVEVEAYLKSKYYQQIKVLSEKHGGYFIKWLEEKYNETAPHENKSLSPTMFLKA